MYETSDSAFAAFLWAFHLDKLDSTTFRQDRCFFRFQLAPEEGQKLHMIFINSEFKRYHEFHRRILFEAHQARRQNDPAAASR